MSDIIFYQKKKTNAKTTKIHQKNDDRNAHTLFSFTKKHESNLSDTCMYCHQFVENIIHHMHTVHPERYDEYVFGPGE